MIRILLIIGFNLFILKLTAQNFAIQGGYGISNFHNKGSYKYQPIMVYNAGIYYMKHLDKNFLNYAIELNYEKKGGDKLWTTPDNVYHNADYITLTGLVGIDLNKTSINIGGYVGYLTALDISYDPDGDVRADYRQIDSGLAFNVLQELFPIHDKMNLAVKIQTSYGLRNVVGLFAPPSTRSWKNYTATLGLALQFGK